MRSGRPPEGGVGRESRSRCKENAKQTAVEGRGQVAGVYLDEGVRRALEDNQRQIAEAEQRQREREEREAAEARKAQEAERAAYYAKHGWPT